MWVPNHQFSLVLPSNRAPNSDINRGHRGQRKVFKSGHQLQSVLQLESERGRKGYSDRCRSGHGDTIDIDILLGVQLLYRRHRSFAAV